MSRAHFVPAIGEQFNHVWEKGLNYKGFDLKFFTEKSHFQHNVGLQSAYYGINGVGKNSKSFRELIGWPKDKILIGDSGGFQLASFKLKGKSCDMKPIDSLRWQEENCDIGLNLDFPPGIIGDVSWKDFKETLAISVKNFELFEKERKNYDTFKLYNVFHGDTVEEMELWFNATKHFKFDGWATGVKPSGDPMIQALGALFLYEKGVLTADDCFGFHFLGMSGKHVVPMLVYFASKLKDKFVTYDSSSYNIGSIYRTYYNRLDIGPHLSFGEKFNPNKDKGYIGNNKLQGLPCICPVCQSIDDMSVLNGGDIFAGTLISLHNMYQYIDYVNTLNSLVLEKDLFLEYMKAMNVNKKCFMSIEFIDFVLENTLEAGIKKYSNWLIPEKSDKTEQKTIFTCGQ